MKKLLPFLIFLFVFFLGVAWQVGFRERDSRDERLVFLLKKSGIEQKDQPIILVNFWASWCTPCLVELPTLVELQNSLKDKILIIGVNADYEIEDFKKAERRYNLNFNSLWDQAGEITNAFGISKLPASFIFLNGKLVEQVDGTRDFASVESIERFEKMINVHTQSN